MIIRLGNFISWLFLPLFIPVIALALTMYIPSEEKNLSHPSLYLLDEDFKDQIIFLFFVFGTLAPGISFLLMFRRKLISTIEMDERTERVVPLLIVFSYCVILFLLFFLKAPEGVLPKYIYAIPFSGALLSLIFFFINYWTKISLHAAGGGMITGYLCAFSAQQLHFNYLIILSSFLISGLIMSARLALNKHTPFQVYLGWIIAFIVTSYCNFYYPFNLF
ncbi:phosphatase PAP2 family protein [Crocinitomicaceae bacterium]|nr:phosphatase PAP2 family protein [Crocinitomicaceae bacterium]